MKHRSLFLFATLLCAASVLAQQTQLSPGVGNAVLLAKNSIQIDQAVVVVSGDVIVNNASSGPFLGVAALALNQSVTTPAGYKLAANSIDIKQAARVNGDVYHNTLTNQGTIAGARITPLALPVYANLPAVSIRPAGSNNVTVANAGQVTLAEGSYGNLVVGNSGTVHLTGGGYAFRSITLGNAASMRYGAPTDIVVSGRLELGNASNIQAENNSGLTASVIRIQVDGINGTNGGMLSTPPSVHVGNAGKVFANVYATAGSIVLDQSVDGTGAFIARDIKVAQASHLTINSAFNLAPTANPQSVSTNGSAPLQITLTGSDPEGGALTFSIVTAPHAGSLSTPVTASPSSANVTYTPTSANVADSFTFRVRDQAGSSGDAIVTINATPDDAPPPAPTTVVATDSSAQTTKDIAATLLLGGTAPSGTSLTFSIVSGTGPFHGSLGAVTQGTEVPERSATVIYTPDPAYTGQDSFQFQACGVIGSNNVCDTALFNITVQTALADPPGVIAHDVEVATIAETPVLLSLGESSIQSSRRLVIKPMAATLQPATIAGNVADSNGDHLGDNANALPGPTPALMSAGVNQSGGAGSNGTVRMQFEWDMANISGSVGALQSAQVVLPTNRGTVDSLDTSFYWVSASGDGNLTNSDFEAPSEVIPDAVMQVPPSMPIGSDGTFSFSVLAQLRASAQNGHTFFAIQGRVNESLGGPARGLQVRTTASGNLTSNDVPMLSLATPGVTAPLMYKITALPPGGVLRDSSNQLITTVPYDLPTPQVSYTPNFGFVGLDTFSFTVSNGFITSSAYGRVNVYIPNCLTDRGGCNNGR
jgi:cytoskeletal protein CcmA (bactofilin family)